MSFSRDPFKQAQKVIFTRKISKDDDPPQINSVSEGNSQKQLGIILDNRLSFEEHLKMTLNKVNKTIGLLLKLHDILPRSALLTEFAKLRTFMP